MNKTKKTIFITVTRGIILRNYFETGLIQKLVEKNLKVVLLIPFYEDRIKRNMFKKYQSQDIIVEIVPNKIRSKIERIMNRYIFSRLVFSKSTTLRLLFNYKEAARKGKINFLVLKTIYTPLSKIKWLKNFFRFIDNHLIVDRVYEKIFDKYNPDLVFSTSIISHFDVEIMKTAKRFGIKTVSMPRSWDNIDKFLLRFEPDTLLVQNRALEKDAMDFQNFKKEKIEVVGFPQFDIYVNKEILISKKKYCELRGFDSSLPILFLGSEGVWSENDNVIFEDIIKARNNTIPRCNILIRPHPSRVFEGDYDHLKKYNNVFVDSYGKDNYFVDNANFSKKDTIDFTNSLYHCSIMITFASTLALDATCFLKPVIAISYGARFNKGKDITKIMYQTNHYQWVVNTGGISLVYNNKKLFEKINTYIKVHGHKLEQRISLRDSLCYYVDGKSCVRINQALLSLINR